MQNEEQLEVRYLIETNIGTYSVYGYIVNDNVISFTEGDGEVHEVHLEDIVRVLKETVQKEDVTDEITKEISLLV